MAVPYASMYKDVFMSSPRGHTMVRDLLSKYDAREVTLFVHSYLPNVVTVRFHNRVVVHCAKTSFTQLISHGNKVVYSLAEDDPDYDPRVVPTKLDLLLSGLNTHLLD